MAKKTTDADAAYNEALKRIKACREEGSRGTELDLSYLGLKKVPPEIGQLTALTELSIATNELTALPPEIGQLGALKSLTLHTNYFTTLPPEIGKLRGLRKLVLYRNLFTALPPEIRQLTALETLDLSNNRLAVLPPEIGQFRTLTTLYLASNHLAAVPPEIGKLTALRTLALDGNLLTALPGEIGDLAALTALYLHENGLTTLPPQMSRLRALKTLYLRNNQLATLPPVIGQLRELTTLRLNSNQLTTLPPVIGQLTKLTSLNLSCNQLTSLPPELAMLEKLTELFLHENAGLNLPESILGPTLDEIYGSGTASAPPVRPGDILNFFFAQRRSAAAGTARPINEIKVMLVGRGGAGKTSLRRFFMNEPHDKNEKETPGIALDNFQLRCGTCDIAVRLWDFAGQEITHALHRFFLTEGCVYVLVLDPRSNTEGRDAEYWLNLLNRYAPRAPVLVATNQQDSRPGGYDVDRNALRERFPSIKAFLPTNCENRAGCDKLLTKLAAVIGSLGEKQPPRLLVPDAWLIVKDACFDGQHGEGPTGYNRQFLTLDEFRRLCVPHGVLESAEQESLARLLHMLGAVLHFIDEPRLRDTAVLNPHWVTDGVYRLMRAKDHPASDGVLTLDEALKAVPSETESAARFLLRLMERFQMCFPLDEDGGEKLASKWLVPGALSEFQPAKIGTEWQQAERVRLRYQYDPLPEGVLPRFIVLTHLLSEGHARWRYGVVLHDAQARALVRKTRENVVEVVALGPENERLRLLEIVQGNLERIHADLPKPRPTVEMELADLPETFRLVADLEAAELGKQAMPVKTEAGPQLVAPTPQLNRASEPEARDGSRVPLQVFLSYSHKDKNAKNIFQDNLTVMQQKQFITPWHDGLIEPGMRWKEEILENLDRMDVFIGLLTNSFLVSNFIQTVEIGAAREKLRTRGKDFLFVLILVDDISLADLDLAEYQILRPGDMAVTQHGSRKKGFNVAQKELETLFKKLQAAKAGEPKKN